MRKTEKILISIFVCLTIVLFSFSNNSMLIVHADSYNNNIIRLEIFQLSYGSWKLLLNTTDSSSSCKIDANKQIRFNVTVILNKTLASSNSEAIEYTKVLMNITNGGTIWNNKELNNTSVSSDANWYYVKENGLWYSNLPQEGVDYTCTIKYYAYY